VRIRLLSLYLIEKEPVSDICDRHGLNPIAVGRWFTAIPFYKFQRQFKASLCLKKPDKKVLPKSGSIPAEGSSGHVTVKWICPIHAEPVQH